MRATDYGLPLTADGHPDFTNAVYDIFNPDRSIGVRAGYDSGRTKAVQLTSGIKSSSEEALAAEIVKVAGVAALRARHGNRQAMEYFAEVGGYALNQEVARTYPSAADVAQAREDAFNPRR